MAEPAPDVHLRVSRPDQELPNPRMFEKSCGPSGSVPPKTPASRLHPARRQTPFTVQRSRTCER